MDRVKRKVVVTSSGCHEYRGAKQSNGYRNLSRGGKGWLVHRYVWAMTYGDIPSGMQVLHRCDNRSCVNPDHLFLGTAKDNTRDMMAKGREKFVGFLSVACKAAKAAAQIFGERHHKARVSDAAVREIRHLYNAERATSHALAKQFSISAAHAYRIGVGISRPFSGYADQYCANEWFAARERMLTPKD